MKRPKNLLAGLALAFTPAMATAGSIAIAAVGQTTVPVQVTLLDAVALGAVPTSTATATLVPNETNPTSVLLCFDISGGTIFDDGTEIIELDGSGVRLFDLYDPSNSAESSYFAIETAIGTVFGNVNGGTLSVEKFNIGANDLSAILLFVSEGLALAFGDVFDLDPLTLEGAQFGVAGTAPSPVPLPAGLPLLAAGLVALALMRRRHTA